MRGGGCCTAVRPTLIIPVGCTNGFAEPQWLRDTVVSRATGCRPFFWRCQVWIGNKREHLIDDPQPLHIEFGR